MKIQLEDGAEIQALSLRLAACIIRLRETYPVRVEPDDLEIIRNPDENFNSWLYSRMTPQEQAHFVAFLWKEWGKAQLDKLCTILETL